MTIWIRYFYEGQKARNGLCLRVDDLACQNKQQTIGSCVLYGDSVLQILTREGVDCELFAVYYYHPQLEGYICVENTTEIDVWAASPQRLSTNDEANKPIGDGEGNGTKRDNFTGATQRIDISLRRKGASYQQEMQSRLLATIRSEAKLKAGEKHGSYFAVGIYRGKTAANHGTLWRSAFQLGASYIFSIGARADKSAELSADTNAAWTRLPYHRYKQWGDFVSSAPYGAAWVAVEMGGQPLDEFEHPPRAIYLLGSEDQGLSSAILEASHYHISIPTQRSASFNVAVAGSIIMYDRYYKGMKA